MIKYKCQLPQKPALKRYLFKADANNLPKKKVQCLCCALKQTELNLFINVLITLMCALRYLASYITLGASTNDDVRTNPETGKKDRSDKTKCTLPIFFYILLF